MVDMDMGGLLVVMCRRLCYGIGGAVIYCCIP